MNGGPLTALAGVWRASDAVTRRAHALGPTRIDAGPVTVVGSADVQRAGDVIAALAGRIPGAPGTAAVAAYRTGGPRGLAGLRGEWSLTLWDDAKQCLVLARDPLGGRSMHYAWLDGGLVFGEDAREILALMPRTPAPDRPAVCTWVASGTMPHDGVLFTGISRLGPGQALIADREGVRTETIWEPSFQTPWDKPVAQIGGGASATP